MGVMRISHVSITATDIEASVNHYANVIGMTVTHRDTQGHVYLKCWDEWDKYSVMLTPSDAPHFNHVAYKVENDSDLDIFAKRINDAGVKAEIKKDILPFCGRALEFRLPSGQLTYLIAQKECVNKGVGNLNPDPWPDDRVGAGVQWLDHCLLLGHLDPEKGINKVVESCDFLKGTLDFHMSERMMIGPYNSVMLGGFMFRGAKPHDLAIFGGPMPAFHHMAFFLGDWSGVLHAGDFLGKNKVTVESTPNRHGVTRGQTIYFYDPSKIRNEIFGGLGYAAYPDMPLITWTPETQPRAYFFHTDKMVEGFATHFTPIA